MGKRKLDATPVYGLSNLIIQKDVKNKILRALTSS